jgi:hypothetical protein
MARKSKGNTTFIKGTTQGDHSERAMRKKEAKSEEMWELIERLNKERAERAAGEQSHADVVRDETPVTPGSGKPR